LKSRWLAILGAAASALFTFAAFPPVNFSLLAWICLVPLLVGIDRLRPWQAALVAFLYGAAYAGLYLHWVSVIPGFPALAYPLVVAYIALYYAAFGVVYVRCKRDLPVPMVLLAPLLWVAFEFVRVNAGFLAVPGGVLGHTQYREIPIIQVASLASAYGVSFIIVAANAALTQLLLWIIEGRHPSGTRQVSAGRVVTSAMLTLAVVVLVYAWGMARIAQYAGNERPLMKAAVIQGNISQQDKTDYRRYQGVLDTHLSLSRAVVGKSPDLIIWPETAVPGYLRVTSAGSRAILDLADELDTPLLLGSSTSTKVADKKQVNRELRNTAFLVDKHASIVAEYDKQFLVPFSEYIPMEGRVPWPSWLTGERDSYKVGNASTIFELDGTAFGNVICWEGLFPEPFRYFVKQGAQFMVNLTNEAWFDGSQAPRQFLAMTVFRAVENGVSVIRSANTGISALIDPTGRIRAKIADDDGNDLMVAGTMTVDVPAPMAMTFYTRYGDVFAILCVILGTFVTLAALLPVWLRRGLLPKRAAPDIAE